MIHVKLHKSLHAASGELKLSVDISLQRGELVSLYGASGAGKTSILRMIAGLLEPEDGYISVLGDVWYNQSDNIMKPTQARNVGMVFQDYALFPNMTVRDNIIFGINKGQSTEIADELIALMDLRQLRDTKPALLSGGQRQRVAVARALARRPSLLLLDEPLAALDTSLRARMQDLILLIHEKFNLTTILVSHDLLEVARLASTVFLLEEGAITKSGKPADVVPFDHIQGMIKTIQEKFKYKDNLS